MALTDNKICKACENGYKKHPDITYKQWDESLFCSRKCGNYNRRGKKLSMEHRKNISKGSIGRLVSKETRERIATANTGKRRTAEQLDTLSKAHLGQKSWNKGKEYLQIKGENHWNWQGGISSEKHKLRNSVQWKLWRGEVFERDDYTCQECKAVGVYLEPHHIIPIRSDRSKAFELTNGITLCRPCHQKTMWKESSYIEKYSQMVMAQWTTIALTDSLQGYWKLDESSGNAEDSTANNNDLTNNNTISYVAAKINNGADMETSSSQYFSITDAAQTGLDFSTAFTFSWWQNLETVFSGTTDMVTLNKWNNSVHTRAYFFRWNNQSSTGMQLQMGNGVSTGDAKVNYTVGTGTFVFIVVTYNAGTLELFVNSTSQGTATGTLPVTALDTTDPFKIGADSSTDSIDGIIDEVGAWSRVLTGTEIADLYNGGAGLSYPFGGGGAANHWLLMGV